MQHAPQTAMARPMDFPGSGSTLGTFLKRNSLPRDFAIPRTTKKFQMRLKNGMSSSHSMPGWMVLDAG